MSLQDDFAKTAELDVKGKRLKSQNEHETRKGRQRQPERDWSFRASKSGQSLKIDEDQLDARNDGNTIQRSDIGDSYHDFNETEEIRYLDMNGRGKVSVHINMMSYQVFL